MFDIERIKTKTYVIDMGSERIKREIKHIGQGITIRAGILPEDFDKRAIWDGKVQSDIPLGVYTAMNVYGYEGGGIKGWGVPKRDFMTKTVNRYQKEFLMTTEKASKKINRKGKGGYTVDKLVKAQVKNAKKWMRDTIENFGGSNSLFWEKEKSKKGMNTNPLRATDTMYNNIKSESEYGTERENKGVKLVSALNKLDKILMRIGNVT